MKTSEYFRPVIVIIILLVSSAIAAPAVTFTTDTFIAATDPSYEGQDIVVTNCTLTVDGAHGFNSLSVLNRGVLAHSPCIYGPQQVANFVSDELQVLTATNPATLDNTNVDTASIVVMNSLGTIVYTEDVDYTVTASNQFVQLELTTNSSIASGSTVLVSYEWSQMFEGFTLAINNEMDIAAGGAINLSGLGYAGGNGFGLAAGTSQSTNFPFTFTAGSGAGHGGCGGMSSTFARGGAEYDSITNPGTVGSGGGTGSANGGAGGGLGRIFVGGLLQIDGQILADGLKGTNAHSGGGAGGSLLLSAQTFSGAGSISAQGGAGEAPNGGGGGGGMIAIYFGSNTFTGSVVAFGGAGANFGGAGTVFMQASSNSAGQLLIVNGGTAGTNTFFPPLAISDLTISGGAIALATSATFSVSNLFIGSDSSLVSLDSTLLALTVNGNATVESNGIINANSKSTTGPGGGVVTCSGGLTISGGYGTGGGYGGYGGSTVCGRVDGNIYGSITQPTQLGSPGGGSATVAFSAANGGGAINLSVAGTLSLAGNIAADGQSGRVPTGGGGSGGSVWLTAGVLSGNGSISANGGAVDPLGGGGGGGGGRIAVYLITNLFTGTITAHGGTGANAGGPGTVYIFDRTNIDGDLVQFGQITIDNGGLTGSTSFLTTPPLADLTITGGAIVTNSQQNELLLRNLLIASNSELTALPSQFPALRIAATNVMIQFGGEIITDGGSASPEGDGQSSGAAGGGGGNGGYGGAGATNALGGIASSPQTITQPSTPGGMGGAGLLGIGGDGGGAISLTASGILQLDGVISANGVTGPGINSGGGAGGSIFLTAATFTGTGAVLANGGAANGPFGGGGGGGHIALDYNTNQFTGVTTAQGGAGANFGGAGTIYLRAPSNLELPLVQQLVVNNGGALGAITPFSGLPSLAGGPEVFDLTVTGGAVLSNSSPVELIMRNLSIGSNSVFLPSPGTFPSETLIVTNATIQAGGSINLDGVITAGSGQGNSQNLTGGGGSYAGLGGASLSNATGGLFISDSITSPTLYGSRGGSGLNGVGGNGGGSLHMTVGTLQLDGRISAQGTTGPGINSGGGSGGAISVSAGTLSGSGAISVNGGAANTPVGGGGGGGRIAVYYNSNSFTGAFTAYGGAAANPGGAGTIFTGPNSTGLEPGPSEPLPQLTVDNGGAPAGLTVLSLYPTGNYPGGNFSFTVSGRATVSNMNAGPLTVQNLLIGSNSTFIGYPFEQGTITVLTNATIQASGSISLDGLGTQGPSPGSTQNSTGGGGSNGGLGGASLSNATGGFFFSDSITSPTSTGSRGGGGLNDGLGGNGGGSLRMTVDGNLQLDGRISAQGTTGPGLNSGGGSGGAIYVAAESLSGSGVISVNGGAANTPVGGGGGGGRIAVYYISNSFTGTLTAYGGAAVNPGGAGTVFTGRNPTGLITPAPFQQLTIDNGGAPAGLTAVYPYPVGNFGFTVSGGANVTNISSIPLTVQNLLIGSNSTFIGYPLAQEIITVLTNATIQAGGKLTADGTSASQNGIGQTANATGGGGGHAGYGGASLSNALGGNVIGDGITEPSLMGGRGGAGFQSVVGGNGGGALRLTVDGKLQLDGRISANGATSSAINSGGGAGGAIWLMPVAISGAGIISANGGAGNKTGGGGGGGCIALSSRSNSFSGNITARGGAGGNYGGAGTIFTLTPQSAPGAQVVIDNGGIRGTNTPVSNSTGLNGLPGGVNLFVNSGAAMSLLPGQVNNFGNITIASNALVTAMSSSTGPGGQLTLMTTGNVDIQAGGALALDGEGFPANEGTGRGAFVSGSGGGGGNGGNGSSGAQINARGGASYNSFVLTPTQAGSGGGSQSATSGSAGGGALRLTVGGTLNVDGALSAKGSAADTAGAGGGSGGSLWLSAKTLSGTGKISADGGNGDVTTSGGGGGGQIAVYFNADAFTGIFSARGGAGVGLSGGAGTIFLETNGLPFSTGSQLTLDNGGSPGANTPLAAFTAPLLILNGANASSSSPLTLQSLYIGSGSTFFADSLVPLDITVFGNALIDSNAAIIADADGYNPAAGPGSGILDPFGNASGGGYGGIGGMSVYGALGGITYGSSNQPTDFGSAGGMSPPLAGFSQGGGAIRLLVDGTLTVNGDISANGDDALTDGAGGGSGGSIWITAETLSGSGSLTVNGGMGQLGEGGGGGGGRIAAYSVANLFSGTSSANGGGGAFPGQPGSIVFATNLLISGSITDTNGTAIVGTTLQPSGLASVVTDTNGAYSVAVPLFWTGTIAPTDPDFFVPNLRTYSNLSSNLANQNFLLASPGDFNINNSWFDGTNLNFSWYGVNGVVYQLMYSTDLINWQPYGPVFVGSNSPAAVALPVAPAPQMFFRLSVNY